MKILITSILLILSAHLTYSQKPQKVYMYYQEKRELSWYEEQEKLWQEEIDKNKENGNAWFNCYYAILGQSHHHRNDPEKVNALWAKLDEVAHESYQAAPNSFESNLLMYRTVTSVFEPNNGFEYLERAYQIDPLDPRTYENLFFHYLSVNNKEKYHEFCVKFFDTNQKSAFVYNWAYNLMSEVDKNAVIFTAGDNDTFPAWVLQEKKGFRTDVTIVNTFHFQLDIFRDKLLEDLGLPKFEFRFQECKDPYEYKMQLEKLYEHFLKNDKGIPVYVSVTAAQQFEEKHGDNLYLTGLTYKYSEEPIDNISLLVRNIEKRHLLDYLTMKFSFHVQDSYMAGQNATYLPAFVKLFRHYKQTEQSDKQHEMEALIKKLSTASNQYEEIKKLMYEE